MKIGERKERGEKWKKEEEGRKKGRKRKDSSENRKIQIAK